MASATAVDQRHAVTFKGVSKAFPAKNDKGWFMAVQDVDLTIQQGEFVCLVGPSGSGKSTLLNMTAGLLTPTTGTVSYMGAPVTETNTDVGYITQQDNLLPWRTLERNVGIALELQQVPSEERERRVMDVLERVGLTGFEDRYPSQLSGGMRKRATLARTLIYEPETLLMDEPFGALDAMLRLTMQRDLLRLWERDAKTVLFVTHDLEEAILLADKVVVFGTQPGRIVHVEDIQIERPRNLVELRHDPHFADVWQRLWDLIEAEMARTDEL